MNVSEINEQNALGQRAGWHRVVGSWPFVCLVVSAVFLGTVYLFGNFGSSRPPELWNKDLLPSVKSTATPITKPVHAATAIPSENQ